MTDLTFARCIETVLRIFAGRESSVPFEVAMVHSGLCFYLDALRGVSDDPAEAIRLHILPGTITTQSGHHCEEIIGRRSSAHSGPFHGYQCLRPPVSSNGAPTAGARHTPPYALSLLVEETPENLILDIRVQIEGHDLRLHPKSLTELITRATGRILCEHRQCKLLTSETQYATITGPGLLPLNGPDYTPHRIFLHDVGGSAIARCLAL